MGTVKLPWIARRSQGFTLLEVLVATTIIAVALGAIIKSTGAGTANLAYLRDKTFAHWVAMNQMAQLQARGKYPAVGKTSGKEEMANRDWYWSLAVKETADKDVRRVEISVRQQRRKDAPVITLVTGFFSRYRTIKDSSESGSPDNSTEDNSTEDNSTEDESK